MPLLRKAAHKHASTGRITQVARLLSQVLQERTPLLRKAADRVRASAAACASMERWRAAHAWVEDSALFYCLTHCDVQLKRVAWWEWPEPLRRAPAAWPATLSSC